MVAPLVLAGISFGLQAYSAISAQNEKNRQIRAANKAKLANWKNNKQEYFNRILLDNAAWKDSVRNSNIAIDNLLTAQAKEWESQDLQLEAVVNAHSANKINIIKKMYEAEYAGEQTGVTAQRKARSSIRDAGHSLTESVRKVILAEKQTDLAKETGAINTEAKRRAQWMETRQPPVPGLPPPPPTLQNLPGNKGLALKLAIAGAKAAVGAYSGMQLEKAAKASQDIAKKIAEAEMVRKKAESAVETSYNVQQIGSASITNDALGQQFLIHSGVDSGLGAADKWLLQNQTFNKLPS